MLGPPGTGKSHLAQAIGRAAILQGYRVRYREAHMLLEEIAEATLDGTRKAYFAGSDHGAASDRRRPRDARNSRTRPPKISSKSIMRRYERASTLLTSNLLCGAPHKRFNAEPMVMRSLV